MDIHFRGRTAIVTGAVRGIGRRIAHDLAARGAAVHALDILAEELDNVARTAEPANGGSLTPHVVDMTDPLAVEAAVRKIEAGGAVDVAVHAAGGVLGQSKQPVEQVTPEQFRAIMEVNVAGAFNLVRAIVPAMKRRKSGRIVIISSRAGLGVSLTGIQSYGTAKAAQIGLVRQLAHELGPFGITVNSVAPGFMPTSPDYVRQYESYSEQEKQALVERTAMRRLGRPEDISHAVMFLASDFAPWVTGQTLCVTGSP